MLKGVEDIIQVKSGLKLRPSIYPGAIFFVWSVAARIITIVAVFATYA